MNKILIQSVQQRDPFRWPALEGKGGLLVSRLLRRAGLTPSPALFILCFLIDQTDVHSQRRR
jgi:hypothetical protein